MEGKGKIWERAEILHLQASCSSIKSGEEELSLHKARIFSITYGQKLFFPQKNPVFFPPIFTF